MNQFTFRRNKVLVSQNYSISIPDGFCLETGVDNRDIMAFQPQNDMATTIEDANILLCSVHSKPYDKRIQLRETSEIYLQEIVKIAEYSTERAFGTTEMLPIREGEVSEYKRY